MNTAKFLGGLSRSTASLSPDRPRDSLSLGLAQLMQYVPARGMRDYQALLILLGPTTPSLLAAGQQRGLIYQVTPGRYARTELGNAFWESL